MDRSVAQGRPGGPRAAGPTETRTTRTDRRLVITAGVLLALAALGIYLATGTQRYYDHFVWQAAAFLEGQAAIRYPVAASATSHGNLYFQDVLSIPTSDGIARGLLPFPPLPAVLLVPFVAVWGLATPDGLLFTALAAIDVAICWWMLGRLRVDAPIRLATAVFFAFGTVFWYTAQVATTWYQAHIVAVGLTMLAIGVALGGDRDADRDPDQDAEDTDDGRRIASQTERAPVVKRASVVKRAPVVERSTRLGRTLRVEPRQFLAGLLFGLAATARLTVAFGAPFFLFVGAGGNLRRRGWSAGLGAVIPIGLLLVYNLVSSGHVLQPAYDYLYRLETLAYPALGYHADWGVEDPRYLPQNSAIMFLTPPVVFPSRLPDSLGVNATPVCTEPGAERGLFDADCPLAVPRDIGMSILLTSPAFLLMIPALRRYGRSRLVTGAALATLFIVVVNLMHFSQGWVQFGYRFSNDAVPFALILVALGAQRLVDRGQRWAMPLTATLVVVSVAVNAWGVAWGRLLGW